MFCKNCGKQIADDAAFCDGCGARQNNESTENEKAASAAQQPSKPNYRVVSWVIGGLALAVFLFISFVFHMNAGSPAAAIQNTVWRDYDPDTTIGKAFRENFDKPKWSDVETHGKPYVEFSGYINDGFVQIYFTHHPDEEKFTLSSAAVDGELVSDRVRNALMQYGFDGDLSMLEDVIETELAAWFLTELFW